ncbi:hypothetical protein HK103_005446 [Boothiomyces macroporosus]|uniref:Uncharacterized protein n=1 Tax=Boothiomyces macroporosus TaxID=261099 RepID=A0AAD5YAW2_9FUNG|nr:hypothetical protein HK103_005446 [Boothiomyces macroporosus]
MIYVIITGADDSQSTGSSTTGKTAVPLKTVGSKAMYGVYDGLLFFSYNMSLAIALISLYIVRFQGSSIRVSWEFAIAVSFIMSIVLACLNIQPRDYVYVNMSGMTKIAFIVLCVFMLVSFMVMVACYLMTFKMLEAIKTKRKHPQRSASLLMVCFIQSLTIANFVSWLPFLLIFVGQILVADQSQYKELWKFLSVMIIGPKGAVHLLALAITFANNSYPLQETIIDSEVDLVKIDNNHFVVESFLIIPYTETATVGKAKFEKFELMNAGKVIRKKHTFRGADAPLREAEAGIQLPQAAFKRT